MTGRRTFPLFNPNTHSHTHIWLPSANMITGNLMRKSIATFTKNQLKLVTFNWANFDARCFVLLWLNRSFFSFGSVEWNSFINNSNYSYAFASLPNSCTSLDLTNKRKNIAEHGQAVKLSRDVFRIRLISIIIHIYLSDHGRKLIFSHRTRNSLPPIDCIQSYSEFAVSLKKSFAFARQKQFQCGCTVYSDNELSLRLACLPVRS